jgi:hypothetical protein
MVDDRHILKATNQLHRNPPVGSIGVSPGGRGNELRQ